MKRLTIKELFNRIEYCYNALDIQYDMVKHCPRDLEDLGMLIHRYEADFKDLHEEYEEWRKKRYEKNHERTSN